eukprot:8892999-Pyramimonas_sp.AAC.1
MASTKLGAHQTEQWHVASALDGGFDPKGCFQQPIDDLAADIRGGLWRCCCRPARRSLEVSIFGFPESNVLQAPFCVNSRSAFAAFCYALGGPGPNVLCLPSYFMSRPTSSHRRVHSRTGTGGWSRLFWPIVKEQKRFEKLGQLDQTALDITV